MSWEHAHNVRNFSITDGNKASACIWECRDNHIGSMFAMTRKVGDILTCSCGYPLAFEVERLVKKEFCHLLEDKEDDFYHVNCVTDLDPGGGWNFVSFKSWLEFKELHRCLPQFFHAAMHSSQPPASSNLRSHFKEGLMQQIRENGRFLPR